MTKKKPAPKTKKETTAASAPSEQAATLDLSGGSNRPPEEGIGERIKKRREELRLNYEELSRMTIRCDYWGGNKGLTSAMIARYEKGVEGKPVLPGAREIRILCDSLNISPEWLLFGVDRQDQSKGAVALANQLVSLLHSAEHFQAFDPSARTDKDWIWQEKLAEVKK